MPMKPLRLLLVGDVHGRLRSLAAVLQDALHGGEHYSAIVCTGDIGLDWQRPGSASSPIGRALYHGSVAAVLHLLKAPRVPLWAVAGNHDHPESLAAAGWPLLCGESHPTRLGGWPIAGFGGSPRTGAGWPHEWDDDATLVFGQAQRGAKILLSHCPPHGTACDRASGARHIGSRRVRDLVCESSPRLVLCGHVHESFGSDELGATIIVNAGAVTLDVPFETRHGTTNLPTAMYSVVTLGADLSVDVEVRLLTPGGRVVHPQLSCSYELPGKRRRGGRRRTA